MDALIINREILPEPIFSYIQTEKIRVFKENGNILLTPIENKPNIDELFGKYTKLSSEEFIKRKFVEKAIES